MKKAIVCIGLICAFSLCTVGCNKSNKEESGYDTLLTQRGKESKYPYSWEIKKNEMKFQIKGDWGKDYSWQFVNNNVNTVSITDDTTKDDVAKYSIKPLASGMAELDFICSDNNNLDDSVYKIKLVLYVSSKNEIEVTDTEYSESSIAEDQNNAFEYKSYATVDGNSGIIHIVNGNNVDWALEDYDDSFLSITGPIYDNDYCELYVDAQACGEGTLSFYSSKAKVKFSYKISVTEDNGMVISEGTVSEYTPTATKEDADH